MFRHIWQVGVADKGVDMGDTYELCEKIIKLKAENKKLKEYLCIKHGYSACPECVKDFRAEQSKSTKLLEALEGAVLSFRGDSVQGGKDYYIGLCCGLEDMDITDRYDAMTHGYSKAIERVEDEIIVVLEKAIAGEKK